MKIFITDLPKAELERLHYTSRDKRVCDRIKAILQSLPYLQKRER